MLAVETREHTIPNIEAPAEDLKVFDISLYRNLFNEVIKVGYSREEARNVVVFAAANDGVGVVTENISGEKDEFGNNYFDREYIVRMQLTPPEHFYLEEDGLMVAPEHKWKDFRKDILDTISNWRRGMDRVGMEGVRLAFLDSSEHGLKLGDTVVWGSPKAEEWEGENVVKYNGAYGFLYVGRVVELEGKKALEVHDFKNDREACEYESLLEELGEVHKNPLYSEHPLMDRVKASYSIIRGEISDDAIWKGIGSPVFGLPTEVIIALQDRELHQRIRTEAAEPVGQWIGDQIYNEIPDEEIQDQIKEKFIKTTQRLIAKLKIERSQDRPVREDAEMFFSTTIPYEYGNTRDYINPALLAAYTGSGGAGCGTWGNDKEKNKFLLGGASVSALSELFGFLEDGEDEHGSLKFNCPKCNRTNRRPRGEMLDSCQHCRENIGC